jgi:transcriptional regulator with XRE-family HTH domain
LTPEEQEDLRKFGVEFRTLRHATFLSQEDFAEVAGISAPYVSLLENGKRRPRPSTLMMIAEKLHEFDSELLPPHLLAAKLIEAAGCGIAPESTFPNAQARRQRRLHRKLREQEKLRQYMERQKWRSYGL